MTACKKRKKTGGRQPGSLNRSTLVGRNVSEIFKNMLGIDDEAVERTGRIDGKGYGFRLRWKQILDGKRTPDSAYTTAVKLSLSYAVGTPIKMQPAVSDRRTLSFITARGLPWENDPLAQREKELLEAQALDDARDAEQRALEAARPPAAEGADAGESLELVREDP